jgi:hypothetical protein
MGSLTKKGIGSCGEVSAGSEEGAMLIVGHRSLLGLTLCEEIVHSKGVVLDS